MTKEFSQFKKWFETPLKQLREKSNGESFFIELLVACVLYERLAVARSVEAGRNCSENEIVKQLADDFGISTKIAKRFWCVVRHGLAHQGMPCIRSRALPLTEWFFHDSYPDRRPIRLETIEGHEVLKVQPSIFADCVMTLWGQNNQLLNQNSAFQWPSE